MKTFKMAVGVILVLIFLAMIIIGGGDLIGARGYETTTGELFKRNTHGGEQAADPDEPYSGFYVYYVDGERYPAYSNSNIKTATIMYDPNDPSEYIIPREEVIGASIGIVGLSTVILIAMRRKRAGHV
ncbi:hypothetical protein SAMN05216413_0961 [Ruminococcaceae bacterium KH2T8]|nr:hypothetical protein SAMN05216413_0961 [Ruminococcaceae bacterium KH2T8]